MTPDLVVHVQNREVALQPDHLGVAPQNFDADRVERAKPRHSLDNLPDHLADAQLHLARRFVGEGDRENIPRLRPAEIQNVRYARCKDTGFSRSRAGQNQHGPVQGLHRLALFWIEIGQIGRTSVLLSRARQCRPAAGAGSSRGSSGAFGFGHVDPGDFFSPKMALVRGQFRGARARPCRALFPPL